MLPDQTLTGPVRLGELVGSNTWSTWKFWKNYFLNQFEIRAACFRRNFNCKVGSPQNKERRIETFCLATAYFLLSVSATLEGEPEMATRGSCADPERLHDDMKCVKWSFIPKHYIGSSQLGSAASPARDTGNPDRLLQRHFGKDRESRETPYNKSEAATAARTWLLVQLDSTIHLLSYHGFTDKAIFFANIRPDGLLLDSISSVGDSPETRSLIRRR